MKREKKIEYFDYCIFFFYSEINFILYFFILYLSRLRNLDYVMYWNLHTHWINSIEKDFLILQNFITKETVENSYIIDFYTVL